MRLNWTRLLFLVSTLVIGASAGAIADSMTPGMPMAQPAASQTVGPLRIVLGFMPAEPFYTTAEAQQQHVTEGMLVVAGAKPVQPDDPSHPNHHLVFHVYDAASGKVLTGARVTITYARSMGAADATPVAVPVVEMQMVGKGPESTHYGNNVTLAPGTYDVTVTINGEETAKFVIKADT